MTIIRTDSDGLDSVCATDLPGDYMIGPEAFERCETACTECSKRLLQAAKPAQSAD